MFRFTQRDTAQGPPPSGTRLAYVAAVVSVFGWASLYPVAKPALTEVSPAMVALARAGIAALVLGALTLLFNGGARSGLAHLRAQARLGGSYVPLVGIVSFTGTSILAMSAQQFLPASVNGLLNNLGPLWLALYATTTGRARSGPLLVAGSLLAAAGVGAVLFGPGVAGAGGFVFAGPAALGVGLSLAGSLLIAAANVLNRRLVRGRDPLALTALAAGWGALPFVLLLLAGVGGSLLDFLRVTPETALRLLWLGTISTAFNFSLWAFALAHLPVNRVAPFQYLIVPAGVALAVLLLGEPAGVGLIGGTAAIVAGIAVAHRGAEPA